MDVSEGLSSKPAGIPVLARKAGKRVTARPWVLTEPGATCAQGGEPSTIPAGDGAWPAHLGVRKIILESVLRG